MTKKNYKIKNYYECESCEIMWDDLDANIIPDKCPECEKEIKPFHSETNILDWDDHYTTVKNHINPDNDYFFETYGDELIFVRSYDLNHVWTLVQDDMGGETIVKGYHFVNRIAYVISEESHENDEETYYF